MEIEPRDGVPPSRIPYNFDAEVKNGNKKPAQAEKTSSLQKQETVNVNRTHPNGTFMDRYRQRFGPDITYVSVATVYQIKDGMLWLDGKPFRKIR